jgi:TetR/AcrR family transcriptional repressor of nem operon
MRRSREDTAATRKAIVRHAARLFRDRGIEAVSVADVMSAEGLTVGGFYRHFADKNQLVAEAIACASAEMREGHVESLEGVPPADVARMILERYLSREHCEHPERGCPVAALCTEVSHEGPIVKAAFTDALRQLLAMAAVAMPGNEKRARDRRLQAAAAMVGALVLARATDDASLADELLASVRKGLLQPGPGHTAGRRGGAPKAKKRQKPGRAR